MAKKIKKAKEAKSSRKRRSAVENPVGVVQGHPDGYGFVVLDDQPDVYLDKREMAQAFPGDLVEVTRGREDRRGKYQGRIVEVLEHRTDSIVGRYHLERGLGFVRPENRKIHLDIVVPPDAKGEAKDGQMVVVDITDQPSAYSPPLGVISEVLGDAMAPGMEIEVALRSFDIPHEWPDAVLEEADSFGSRVSPKAKKDRQDLTHLDFVTIDGEDAKDFDDAVYAERTKAGWTLWVAIADVSHYVKPGSALDQQAEERGTSVYFPEYVVPMLPEVLSNGLCSLRPKVDRLAMVCKMQLSAKGEIKKYQFSEATIRSKARLTYTRVAKVFEEASAEKQPERNKLKGLATHLDTLRDIYQVLLERRKERGALDFDSAEVRFEFDDNRKIKNIVPVQRNDAHRLIEECMLCANICAARFLAEHEIPALYRVHEPPADERLESLRDFLAHMGVRLSLSAKPEPAQFSKLIQSIEGRPDRHLIQMQILRAQQQAVYQPENYGHFGLAYEEYAHFTSPIRRYPDLLVHRAIRSKLARKKQKNQLYPYSLEDMQALGTHCSTTERRAEEASRDVIQWLKCEYIKDRVGEQMLATITGVTQFGLFAELEGIYVEGLIHITSLPYDYYEYDPIALCLTGQDTKRTFSLGDRALVTISRVSLEERRVDLVLANTGDNNHHNKKTSNRSPGSRTDKRPRKERKNIKKGRGKGDKKYSSTRSSRSGGSVKQKRK